jgi:hypothetical protein
VTGVPEDLHHPAHAVHGQLVFGDVGVSRRPAFDRKDRDGNARYGILAQTRVGTRRALSPFRRNLADKARLVACGTSGSYGHVGHLVWESPLVLQSLRAASHVCATTALLEKAVQRARVAITRAFAWRS